MTLLDQMADPNLISQMSIGDKLSGGLLVTVLGIGITFAVLMVLWVAIVIMSRMINGSSKKAEPKPVVVQKVAEMPAETIPTAESGIDDELIAVITAAIASSLNTSMHHIIVKNIVEYPTMQAAWSKAGITEQIQTRY